MDKPGNSKATELGAVARLPAPDDNVAIALGRIEEGSRLVTHGASFRVEGTVPEGHRLAAAPIKAGGELRSWGRPFGLALRDIRPGEYVCNQSVLELLGKRNVSGVDLPKSPNFEDRA